MKTRTGQKDSCVETLSAKSGKDATRQAMRFTRHIWSVSFRDARGNTMGLSCASPTALLEDALRFNAVAITLHRERKCGKYVEPKDVRGIFKDR